MKASERIYVNVIVDQPGRSLARAFTYLPPQSNGERIRIGSYVLVPFGGQRLPGFVVGFSEEPPPVQAKRILGLLVDEPLFSETELDYAQWLATEYHCSLGEALRCYLPPGAARNIRRRVVLTTERPADELLALVTPRATTQKSILEALIQAGGELPLEVLSRMAGRAPESGLRALEKRGLVQVVRELGRPMASEKRRRVAVLRVSAEQAIKEAGLRETRAPRQAQLLRTLASTGAPVPTANLSEAAVTALERDGLVSVHQERVRRAPNEPGLGQESATPHAPTPEQREALSAIAAAMEAGGGEVLLHGVTGSGKTEVYLQAIAEVRSLDRSAIVLVPEISLTPQLVGRFRARFGDELALLHSAIAPGERLDEWQRVKHGEARIVIGARSAVFAPVKDLGLLVIDEEHEQAYKQDRAPRYDARRVAAERCRREGAVLLLGSATPSVETYYRFRHEDGRRRVVELPRRIDDRPLPLVEIVDMRGDRRRGEEGPFSEQLTEALRECLAAGNQAILFLNRRGFSTFVMCRECGFSLRCPNCAVSLTYHHRTRKMVCHHCEHSQRVPDICPSCEGTDIGFHGLGTERVADQLERRFPEARVIRMDRDTTARSGAHGGILREFASGKANVMVGTQMIAKGLDLPNVTLVGVVNADVGLNRPDFRAAEHTFQLLAQVAGRAGRAHKPGRVVVQTYNPEHYAIRWASEHDFLSFYHEELERRRQVRGSPYPPFGYLLAIHVSDENEATAAERAMRLGRRLREIVGAEAADITIGGPAPAPLSKLRGRYRWLIVPRGRDRGLLHDVTYRAIEALPKVDQESVYVDVDPVDMM